MITQQNTFEKFKQNLDLRGLEGSYPSPEAETIKSQCKIPPRSCPKRKMVLHPQKEAEFSQHQNKGTLESAAEGRIRVETTTQWPYSVHGIVSFKMKDIHCWGTGTLIGPNIVLTAGYNLYSHREKAYSNIESMQFLPGVNGQLLPFGVAEVKTYFVSPNYIEDEEEEDYGILILKEPIGNKTGYFGLACLEPEELKSKTIHITGYPADKVASKPNTYEMWGMQGTARDIDQERSRFNHSIETDPGQGGSGVWFQEGEDYYVCGVHLSGVRFAKKATLLTRAIYAQIYQWVHEVSNDQSLLGFDNIKELGFEGCKIDASCLSYLAKCDFDKLTILRLSSLKIQSKDAKVLAQNRSWLNLSELDLSKNNIGSKGVKALAENSTWINLSKLNLQSNKIGPKGAKALAKNTSWVSLSELYLQSNKIGPEGAKALAQNRSWVNLSKLDLSNNDIYLEGAKALLRNAKWVNLSELILQSNKIGTKQAKKLTHNTSWENFSELDLERNAINIGVRLEKGLMTVKKLFIQLLP